MSYPVDDWFNDIFRHSPYTRNMRISKSMKDMENLFRQFLDADETKTKMDNLGERATLTATVKKNGKVYKITVENITPKPEEIPEEIEINWNNSHDFGNHEDITEWCNNARRRRNLK